MAEVRPPSAELRGHPAAEEAKEKPIADLLRQLADETGTLVRQEMALARAELTAKARDAGVVGGIFGAAGVLGLAAVGALTACVIAALALAMPLWGAALTVAGVEAAGAAVLAMLGRNRLRRGVTPVPEQTVETVKEDVEWAKTRAQSGRR